MERREHKQDFSASAHDRTAVQKLRDIFRHLTKLALDTVYIKRVWLLPHRYTRCMAYSLPTHWLKSTVHRIPTRRRFVYFRQLQSLRTDGFVISGCLNRNIVVFMNQPKTKFIDPAVHKLVQHRPGVQTWASNAQESHYRRIPSTRYLHCLSTVNKMSLAKVEAEDEDPH